MNFTNYVLIQDPTSILPHLHNFPTQRVKIHNQILTGDDHIWYADSDINQAEVLIGIERLRGNVSLFSESEAAVSKAIPILFSTPTTPQPGTKLLSTMQPGEFVTFSSVNSMFIDLINKAEQLASGFSIDVGVYVALVMDDKAAALLKDDPNLKPLIPEDATTMVKYWDYAQRNPKGAMECLLHNIAKRPTAGIRGEDGRLLGWASAHVDWNIAMLTVLEQERRKGYGKRIVEQVSYNTYKLGHMPYAFVAHDNVPSMAIFTGLGFKKTIDVAWIVIQKV